MSTRSIISLALALTMLVPAIAVALSAPSGVDAARDAAGDGATFATHAGGTVTIKRDDYGVPHVYADDLYGLFWGNGYAQAQDRLFQLDVLRHVGKGEAARFLGPSLLESDLATRRELYTDEERTARWNALPEEQRQMFQGYADGVNAWIEKTRADPTLLSAEFYAIAHAPEYWVAEDTIAIAEYLLDIFGAGSGGNEVANAQFLFRLMDELGPEDAEKAFNDFYPMHDPDAYVTVPADEYTYPATEGPLAFDDIPALQWEVAKAAAEAEPFAGAKSLQEAAQEIFGGLKFGSNAAVISPKYAESGNALLLGGPQMAYFNPMVPYEVGLHGAGLDAVGMGVGGAPGMIIGRNAHMAWTVTSGSSDQVDVVAVKLVEGSNREYYLSGKSGATTRMDCREEVHFGPPTAVDVNPPVLAVQEVCRTVRGPVFAINEDMGYAFVRERTHRLDELRSGILWLTLAANEDLASFQDHMESFCFEFNFHVADDSGNIAYLHFGCQPVRASGYDPRLPRLAGAWDWVDVKSGKELPYIVNPEKGYLVNWNNKPAAGWSGGDAVEKWGPVNRAVLFEDAVAAAIAEDGKLDVADLEAINVHISTRSPFPPHFVPAILAATAGADDPTVQAARAALEDWRDTLAYGWDTPDASCKITRAPDACFGTYHPGFAVYETWRGLVQEMAFRDEMGPFMREMGFVPEASSDPHAADHGREDNKDNVLYNAIRGRSGYAWCDDLEAPGAQSCHELLAESFARAVGKLEARFGTANVDKWRQEAHTIKFAGLSGGPAWRIHMVNRPSFNHLYDWGTGHAASVLPPGTNQYWYPADFIRYSMDGTLPDPHKRDQLDLYADFAYKPANLHPAVVAHEETLTAAPPLLPALG